MKLNVKYFGMIAESLKKSQEIISVENTITVGQFKNLLLEKYDLLNQLDFKIAVNQSLVSDAEQILNDAEIALLPPFAGG